MKKALLFDLDDTLLDFKAAEKFGLTQVFSDYEIPETPENIASYKRINHKLWKDYEEGYINREMITGQRFPLFFKEVGVTEDGLKAEEKYRHYLELSQVEMPGARALLDTLVPDYDLYLVTNGVASTQKNRLVNTNLGHYFSEVFISEELGVQKPDPAFFAKVFEKLPHLKKEEALLIGDSLTSDIQGGKNSQIDTVWYNPFLATGQVRPTYEIQELQELPDLLQKIS